MAIRITTLSLMTPWDKELADLEELVEHLKRIGYVRPTIPDPDAFRAADGVYMAAQDEGTADYVYVIAQDLDSYARRRWHRIELPYVDAGPFEDMCYGEWRMGSEAVWRVNG